MDWREKYRDKIVSAEAALARVQSGQVIGVAMGAEPLLLLTALARRANTLAGVHLLDHYAMTPHPWYADPPHPAFTVETSFLTDISRPAMARRQLDFLPMTVWGNYKPEDGDGRRDAHLHPDVVLITISPPDDAGTVSLGTHLWQNRTMIRNAGLVIAEVNENYVRTPGDNSIPIEEIDLLVLPETPPPLQPLSRAVPPAELELANAIAALAATLIRDGDTLQFGFGLISAATATALEHHNDLGLHSENLFPSVLQLIKNGNMTGARKTFDTGLHVACGMFLNPGDYDFVNNNPAFSLRESRYTNDPKIISRHPNMVSVNAAIAVDLTGQISAEAFGYQMFSGVGGQLDFQIGALLSRGGRAITVLPSTARRGEVSRITARFPEGQVITVPRTYADFIVTEYGIACLQGKTLRQRAAALIEIAHPRFRETLMDEARQMFGGI